MHLVGLAVPLHLRVAFCCSASRGIGRAIALAFAAHDATIILSARNVKDLEEVSAISS